MYSFTSVISETRPPAVLPNHLLVSKLHLHHLSTEVIQVVMELWQSDLKLLPQLPQVIKLFFHNSALFVLMVTPVQSSEMCWELFVGLVTASCNIMEDLP